LYVTGNHKCKNAVILIPDYFGWYKNRVQNIADCFADNNLFAVIPNFESKGYEPTKEGETHSGILDWYKAISFDGHLKPVLMETVDYMKKEGAEKISLLGFSWGAWVCVNLLASDISDEFCCAALPNPSLDLEERVYGGSLAELMSKVNRPLLMMPTKGDPDTYTSFMKLLKYKFPSAQVVDYHDMVHEFIIQGNTNDELIRARVQKAMDESTPSLTLISK